MSQTSPYNIWKGSNDIHRLWPGQDNAASEAREEEAEQNQAYELQLVWFPRLPALGHEFGAKNRFGSVLDDQQLLFRFEHPIIGVFYLIYGL